MVLKIRLRQQGRRNSLKYRLVVADARSPRDGRFVEIVGHYDPALDAEKQLTVHGDRVSYWIDQGAQMSEKVTSLVKRGAPEVIQALRAKEEAKKKSRGAKKTDKK